MQYNRTRNKQIILRFTEGEAEYFKKFKDKTQISCYSDFVLHLLTHSQIYNIDTTPLISTLKEINKIGINVNQIAKAVNTTGNVYRNEITDLQNKIGQLEKIVTSAYSYFVKVKDGKF